MHPVLVIHSLIRLHAPVGLCFHSVGDGPDALPAATFTAMLEWLQSEGYRFLTAEEATTTAVLRRSVLLTFDDGRKDNISTVLPLLRRYNASATFYVCSDLVGRVISFPPYPNTPASDDWRFELMDWADLARLREAGMCIGSHGATHADLVSCSDADLEREVAGSGRTLLERTGRAAEHFAYPWGRFDRGVIEAVRAAGYRTAAAVSRNEISSIRPWDPYTLPRITVPPQITAAQLRDAISFPRLVHRSLGEWRHSLRLTWTALRRAS